MAVLVDNEEGLALPIEAAEISQIVEAALSACAVTRPTDVSVGIVTDERMRELNRTWRAIDAPTDVLSFECDSPFDDTLPAGEPVELGDVILAPAQIERQAPAFGGTPADEFRLMLVHGTLHLLGFDHIDEGGAQEMEALELEILRGLAHARGDDADAVRIGPTTRHVDD